VQEVEILQWFVTEGDDIKEFDKVCTLTCVCVYVVYLFVYVSTRECVCVSMYTSWNDIVLHNTHTHTNHDHPGL